MSHSLKELIRKLDLENKSGLYYTQEENWEEKVSPKVYETIKDKIQPKAFFHLHENEFEENFIFFFEFLGNPSNEEVQQIHKSCWNFNKVSVIFFLYPHQIQIFNGYSFDHRSGFLNKLAHKSLIHKFSYWELISGETWNYFTKEFTNSKKKRVDVTLLKNIGDAKLILEQEGMFSELANSLMGRLIFTRYLLDRSVTINFKNQPFTHSDFEYILQQSSVELLYELFSFLNDKFLADAGEKLFPTIKLIINPETNTKSRKVLTLEEEKNNVKDYHIHILYHLFTGTDFQTHQRQTLFGNFRYYDFEIIPIEFISSIYELFIGEEKQKNQASYYTPLFLAEYILNSTVKQYFLENESEYNCRVLDPSCGSGIFLVETLRRIINQYQKIHNLSKTEIKSKLKDLVCENIFGVDKDPEAINIAIFSIYITLLDFQEPKDISTFQFPNLRSNFFEGDFFDDEFTDDYLLFKTRLTSINFDFILGNPPWGTPTSEAKELYEVYAQKKAKNEQWPFPDLISNREIAQAFLIRISDIAVRQKKSPVCALIITSKILYNNQTAQFRQYFLNKFFVDQIVELSPVRKQVFDKKIPKLREDAKNKNTVGPPSILFYRYAYGASTEDNIVKHISIKPNRFFNLFKIIVVEKYDYKEIQQEFFIKYDWIWKLLVYGSVRDFYFIKRLKEYATLANLLSDESRFLVHQGFKRKDGERRVDASQLKDKKLIYSRNGDLQLFYINPNLSRFTEDFLAYIPSDLRIFSPPMLLIKGGTDRYFKTTSAISNQEVVFNSAFTSIKSISKTDNDKSILKTIGALLQSHLCSYYYLLTGSSVGIEREELHDTERLTFPMTKEVISVDAIVDEIEKIKLEIETSVLGDIDREIRLKALFIELENKIRSAYKVSSIEHDLIHYALEVSIPLFHGENFPYEKLSNPRDVRFLKEYANVFIKHFKKLYQFREDIFIACDIYISTYAIAMDFKFIDYSPENEINIISAEDTYDTILKMFVKISFEKVTEQLYIQKDIKGFNKKSFYIIKPNEYKLWHRAIAHTDLNEVLESIINKATSLETEQITQ